MRKPVVFSLLITTVWFSAVAQTGSYKQPASLGIHFLFNDFATAAAIRSTSLSAVIRENRFGKLKDMTQGLALTYGKGLSEHFDFNSMFTGSFLSYPVNSAPASGSDYLLLELDATIRGKLVTNRYWVVPFFLAGAGVSKYQGYWGTFIPTGIGIQVNFFDEAYLQFTSQYRIAVTESAENHFVHSIGLSGNIGRRN